VERKNEKKIEGLSILKLRATLLYKANEATYANQNRALAVFNTLIALFCREKAIPTYCATQSLFVATLLQYPYLCPETASLCL
jgi:hypothetical protein